MTIFKRVADEIEKAVKTINADADISRMTVETPRDPSHGDLATNAAMLIAKPMGMNPRELAQKIIDTLSTSEIFESLEIAGPGFINMRLTPQSLCLDVKTCLETGTKFGEVNVGNGEKVNIEYVSVNPTGPMHAGHVRGAVVGDTLASLLSKAGYDVTKEYYFNDAGKQIEVLAHSTYLRYKEALGENIGEIAEGLYPGDYLKDVAKALIEKDGDKWFNADEAEWYEPVKDFAVKTIIELIREDLKLINIEHDVFTNERVLIENGTLDKSFKFLEDKDLIYTGTLPPPRGKEMEDWEPVPLTLFRSSNFGDDVDRPLKKRDGTWAYIMPDIAYHYDKIQRGFNLMINLLGKDHGGYEQRIGPVVDAFSDGKASLKVVYNGMVKVLKNGVPVKLSKRSGNLITLREMVEEVGADAVRFFMMTRTPDSELEFDFTKVIEQSKDNPVFYVQYVHARCCSVMRHAADMFDAANITDEKLAQVDMSVLGEAELDVVKVLINWPRIVEQAAQAFEPHRVAFYLQDVAAAFHSWWNKGKDDTTLRFLQEDKKDLTLARLAVVRAVATTIASGLDVLGVEPMEEMRSEVSDAA